MKNFLIQTQISLSEVASPSRHLPHWQGEMTLHIDGTELAYQMSVFKNKFGKDLFLELISKRFIQKNC